MLVRAVGPWASSRRKATPRRKRFRTLLYVALQSTGKYYVRTTGVHVRMLYGLYCCDYTIRTRARVGEADTNLRA